MTRSAHRRVGFPAEAGSEHGADDDAVAHLRDGRPVGAWLLKANPATWDIGSAIRDGTPVEWWRLAHSYRVEMVHPGQPCALWITRGDRRVPSGLWALGEIASEPYDDSGDPDDPLWRDEAARRAVRPRIAITMCTLDEPVLRETFLADPRLHAAEILTVPRIANPAALTPAEWAAVQSLAA